MHGNNPLMFDCWADPVVRLLELKSSISIPKLSFKIHSKVSADIHKRITSIKFRIVQSTSLMKF